MWRPNWQDHSDWVFDALNNNAYQAANITVTLANGTTLSDPITNADILAGGLSVDRYTVSSGNIIPGTAIASELNLKLNNHDGRFNDVNFAGAELYVTITVQNPNRQGSDSASCTIPLGYYIVTNPPRMLSGISITALDRMIKFDKPVDPTHFISVNPYHVSNMWDILRTSCVDCGVVFKEILNYPRLPNITTKMEVIPSTTDTLTYRQLMIWAASLLGVCLYINYDGKLTVGWYNIPEELGVGDFVCTPETRYNGEIYNEVVNITGVFYKDVNDEGILVGNGDYVIDYTNNKLIPIIRYGTGQNPSDIRDALTQIYNGQSGSYDDPLLPGFPWGYTPFSATVKPVPYLWPMDSIDYEEWTYDDNGEVSEVAYHLTALTNVHYVLNGVSSICASGNTQQETTSVASGAGTSSYYGNQEFGKSLFNGTATFNYDVIVRENKLLKVVTATGSVSVSSSSASETGTLTVTPGDGWTPIGVVGFAVSQSWCFVRSVRLISGSSVEIAVRYTGTSTSSQTVTLTADVLCLHTG